jgi:adenosine deaminase
MNAALDAAAVPNGELPPLADLHRHLDGSLRQQTLDELAASAGVGPWSALRFSPAMGLDAALACFEKTLSVLQRPDAVQRVASEICDDAAADGVTTLEIRFAPQLHRGAAMEAIVDAALEGIDGRGGLILCALYGDAPELVAQLVALAAARSGVVGIDLAGGPTTGHRYRMADYRDAFTRAAELGLGRTIHAGEGRPAAEIRQAIEQCHAQRIGHGVSLLDDPKLVELVVERGITIEACPTSNVHTGIIERVEQHPLPRWLALGVRACVCPDNTLLSDVCASDEHRNVLRIPGMSRALLERAISHGHAAAFG